MRATCRNAMAAAKGDLHVRMDRRQFGAAALASFAFPGLVALARAQAPADDYLNQAEGYGPLQPDPAGLFDLPAGFGYRIVSQAGEAMDDGYAAPGHFDGMVNQFVGGT